MAQSSWLLRPGSETNPGRADDIPAARRAGLSWLAPLSVTCLWEAVMAPVPHPTIVAPPAGPACVPGRDGVPGSIVGNLLCGQYTTGTPVTGTPVSLWDWLAEHRLQLVVLGIALVTVRAGWALARAVAVRRQARGARWLEIVPPVSATPAATVALWQLLATLLPAPRRLSLTPRRLVWEIEASGDQMRCGLWVPPGVSPTAVIRSVQRAWPGAHLTAAGCPAIERQRVLVGRRLVQHAPDWQLLTDPAPSTDDEIRAVFAGLAAAGRTGAGLLQVVVARAPRFRLADLRRATRRPSQARSRRGWIRGAAILASAVQVVLRTVLDLLTPGPTARASRTNPAHDPELAERTKQARGKLAAGPHFVIEIRALTSAINRPVARAACAEVTAGFALLSPDLAPRRLARPRSATRLRPLSLTRGILVSVAELAALTGVPAEPAAYGLPAAAARRRPPVRGVWHAGPASSATGADQ